MASLKHLSVIAAGYGLEVRAEDTGLEFVRRQYRLMRLGQKVGLVWAPTRQPDTWNAQETVRHRGAWGGISFDLACDLIASVSVPASPLTNHERFCGPLADSFAA